MGYGAQRTQLLPCVAFIIFALCVLSRCSLLELWIVTIVCCDGCVDCVFIVTNISVPY